MSVEGSYHDVSLNLRRVIQVDFKVPLATRASLTGLRSEWDQLLRFVIHVHPSTFFVSELWVAGIRICVGCLKRPAYHGIFLQLCGGRSSAGLPRVIRTGRPSDGVSLCTHLYSHGTACFSLVGLAGCSRLRQHCLPCGPGSPSGRRTQCRAFEYVPAEVPPECSSGQRRPESPSNRAADQSASEATSDFPADCTAHSAPNEP